MVIAWASGWACYREALEHKLGLETTVVAALETSTGEAGARRALPSVQRVMQAPALSNLTVHAPIAVKAAARAAVEAARQRLDADPSLPAPGAEALAQAAREQLELAALARLGRVINATGVVLHTNLGRAPMAAQAVAAAAQAGVGYCNLEYDLAQGRRGRRGGEAEALLAELTGAEAALVVNNNAAAVLLALSVLAAGAEVIVSRGELVEIGGGFRVPDVIRQGGARLVEVGTTNRTHLKDYAQAVTPETRVVLKAHPSNYRMSGFVAEVGLAELSGLCRAQGLALVEDLGSGALVPLGGEPTVASRIAAGADLVSFSGDKLMGGPQAGLIVGRSEIVERLRRHPLMRALRCDKLTLAALEATLRLYQAGQEAQIPVVASLRQTPDQLRARARRLADLLAAPGIDAVVVASTAYAGGGSLPEHALDSVAVAVRAAGSSAETLAARLRRAHPPAVGRIADDLLMLDMLTITDEEVAPLAAAMMGN
jgi:L-seryl-tRNA(Ser) seleniumtransferase